MIIVLIFLGWSFLVQPQMIIPRTNWPGGRFFFLKITPVVASLEASRSPFRVVLSYYAMGGGHKVPGLNSFCDSYFF